MKRLVVAMVLILMGLVGWAYADKITPITGSATVSLAHHDSTGWLPLVNPLQISEMSGGSVDYDNFQWDRIMLVAYMTHMTDAAAHGDGGCTNEAKVDTLKLRVRFGSQYYYMTPIIDSGALPDTVFYEIARDAWADPSTSSDSVEGWGFGYPDYMGNASAFDQDQMWIDYFVTDTAGAGDSCHLTGTLNYYLKFFKDGE